MLRSESSSSQPDKSGRKYKQGQLLLVALLENFVSTMLYAESKEVNKSLFATICSQLVKMGIISEATYFNDELSNVRKTYKRAFMAMIGDAMRVLEQEGSSGEEVVKFSRSLSRLSFPITENKKPPCERDFSEFIDERQSRYFEDFEEIGALGKGAFGNVMHCINRLDGQEYAIKIINCSKVLPDSDIDKIFRECKLLASITHPNVVRYYSSWLQHIDYSVFSDLSDEGVDETEDTQEYQLIQKTRIRTVTPVKDLCFFIHMELCQTTLHQMLESRNQDLLALQDEELLKCLHEVLLGIDAIHDNGYLHRDIKPRNIFFKSIKPEKDIDFLQGVWKIGDFGLATSVASVSPHEMPDSEMSEEMSHNIGTVIYASPEQLSKEGTEFVYSTQTDMYSLGIVFFELIYPLKTAMERAEKIQTLRSGILPDELLKSHPKEVIHWF